MMRFIKLFVLCAALLALLPGADIANAQAAASPCAVRQGQVDTTACVEFLTYLRDSSRHWGESTLLVPESTMGEAPARYVSHWDDNNVAYIPESTMGEASARYVPHWDDNDVAYIPESTMDEASARYVPHWDDNDVAYIPESTMGEASARYVPHWDDNDVAYIPESTMNLTVDEVLSLHQTQEVGN